MNTPLHFKSIVFCFYSHLYLASPASGLCSLKAKAILVSFIKVPLLYINEWYTCSSTLSKRGLNVILNFNLGLIGVFFEIQLCMRKGLRPCLILWTSFKTFYKALSAKCPKFNLYYFSHFLNQVISLFPVTFESPCPSFFLKCTIWSATKLR